MKKLSLAWLWLYYRHDPLPGWLHKQKLLDSF